VHAPRSGVAGLPAQCQQACHLRGEAQPLGLTELPISTAPDPTSLVAPWAGRGPGSAERLRVLAAEGIRDADGARDTRGELVSTAMAAGLVSVQPRGRPMRQPTGGRARATALWLGEATIGWYDDRCSSAPRGEPGALKSRRRSFGRLRSLAERSAGRASPMSTFDVMDGHSCPDVTSGRRSWPHSGALGLFFDCHS